MKKRKIKYKSSKFFGHPEDSWARLGGRHGKKRSYGHFGSGAGGSMRTRAEKKNAADLNDDDEKT